MQKSFDVLARLESIGLKVDLSGVDKLVVSPRERITIEARELIIEHKAELLAYLKAKPLLPYLDVYGSLMIPFDSHPKYHYWKGRSQYWQLSKN